MKMYYMMMEYYSGKLKIDIINQAKYLNYDKNTNNPVHMTWKVIDWNKVVVENALGTKLKSSINTVSSNFENNKKSINESKIIDFETQYKNNKSIGTIGEDLIYNREKEFFIKNNQGYIANEVKKTIETIGNTAPYDIEYRFENGSVKYIEVKSTTGDLTSNFFISEQEIDFARENKNSYFLYRVYNIDISNLSFNLEIIAAEQLLNLKLKPILFAGNIKQ